MKKLVSFFSLLVVIMFLFSCEKKTINPILQIDLKDTVYFQKNIVQGIFDVHCTSCHGQGGSVANFDFTSTRAYITITNFGLINRNDPTSSILVTHHNNLQDRNVSQTERQSIINWIAQGAKNN